MFRKYSVERWLHSWKMHNC